MYSEKHGELKMRPKSRAQPVQALTATLAVALMLAATRWGSYIGAAPLLLTDLLIASAIVHRVLSNSITGVKQVNGKGNTRPGLLITVFIAYGIARMMTSFGFAFGMDWLRDAMPFLYSGLAFLSASSFARSTVADRVRTMKILWWALIFHLLWVSAIVWSGVETDKFPSFPNAGTSIFSLRPDVDMAFLGVIAGLLLRKMIRGEHPRWSLAGLVLALATAMRFGTRAGLISLAISVTAAYLLTFSGDNKHSRRRMTMVFIAPVIIAVALAAVANTTGGQRLMVSIAPSFVQSAGVHELNAAGTQAARELTWDGVVNWVEASGIRMIFGGGFGNNFLEQSGVLQFLQGSDYLGVRSPHNWMIGIYARMGIIGVLLSGLIIMALLRKIIRERIRIGQEELLTLSTLTILAIFPVAMLGVVLESPFGAVPFWWFVGIIFSLSNSGKEEKKKSPTQLPLGYKHLPATRSSKDTAQ